MKTRDGFRMCYNLQTGVSDRYKMITYAQIVQKQNDLNRLSDNIKEQKEEIGLVTEISVADGGYYSDMEITKIKREELSCFIPIPKTRKAVFIYNEEDDTYTCPENRICIKLNSKGKSKDKVYYIYECKDCGACPSKKGCNIKETTNKKRIWIDDKINKKDTSEFKKKMNTKEARKIIKRRKEIVEHPYGTIKRWFGKLGFLVTGLRSVQTEIDIVTTAYNIKRLLKVENNKEILFQQLEVYFNIKNTQK